MHSGLLRHDVSQACRERAGSSGRATTSILTGPSGCTPIDTSQPSGRSRSPTSKDIETGHEHTTSANIARNAIHAAAPCSSRPSTSRRSRRRMSSFRRSRSAVVRSTLAYAHENREGPQLHAAAPACSWRSTPADANRLGVLDGDRVRIVSRRGSVVAPAKVGDVVPPGVVFVPFHYGDLARSMRRTA